MQCACKARAVHMHMQYICNVDWHLVEQCGERALYHLGEQPHPLRPAKAGAVPLLDHPSRVEHHCRDTEQATVFEFAQLGHL